MSLFDYMQKYGESGALRLHTPGHKGRLTPLDITELTDGSFPAPQIIDAEENIAKAYGTRHAHLLCCGSSQGVKSAIYFAHGSGIIDIHSHRSVFDGFELSDKKPIAVKTDGVHPVTVDGIKKALDGDVKAVVVTSPTYYGFAADLSSISELCRCSGLLFIVDGAHGAHFGFSKRLPESPAKYADICNLSVHKTLSALTQSAILLDNLNDADSARLKNVTALMGSTSPSYLLYASAESAVEKAKEKDTAAAYEKLYDAIAELKRSYPFLDNDDFTRLVLDCAALGISGNRLNRSLAAQGVMSELVTERYIVFIFTAENTPGDVERLGKALCAAIKLA